MATTVVLHNEGAYRVPDEFGRRGRNYFLLKNQQWNHVVWEIAHLSRDQVTGVEFAYRMQGHEPGATDTVRYYVDTLDLQKVAADHSEGWTVSPGRIAYSHTGYALDRRKLAFTCDPTPSEFTLIDAATGGTDQYAPAATTD